MFSCFMLFEGQSFCGVAAVQILPQEGDNFPLTYKGNQWTELQERSNMVNEFHPQNAAF